MLNRIVLFDEAGMELFSGRSIASDPPPRAEEEEEACPPTLRSIAPPAPTEESGVFVREVTAALEKSAKSSNDATKKDVDENAA